jgi:hypothetical protein
MTLTHADRTAVALYPELRRLIMLREDRRWRFTPNYRHDEMVLVVGVRVWPLGWSDVVAIADRDDARAARWDPAGGEVKSWEGGLAEVIDALVEVPAPGQFGAPHLVRGPARRLWLPGHGPSAAGWTGRLPV